MIKYSAIESGQKFLKKQNVFGTFSGRVQEICTTQLLEPYFVFIFIVVHKQGTLI